MATNDQRAPDPNGIAEVQSRLLAWWSAGHRDLPWRRTRDPYAILVSEVMLQQTQVARVVPKFNEFMQRFPSLADLAAAPVSEVIRAWSGLGYNRRAVNLHRLARVVVAEHGGRLPSGVAELRALPGVGSYTARAVAALAFGVAVAPVDTNVRRVLTRVFDGSDTHRPAAGVQALADAVLVVERPGDWNQSLMELGALVCLPTPRCTACPLAAVCAGASPSHAIRERRTPYRADGARPRERFEHSARFYRGRIVEMLRSEPAGRSLTVDEVGARLRLDYGEADRAWLVDLLQGLVRDRLVRVDDAGVALPEG
jgi:A/G-specific adenine glycosylase